MTPGQRYLDLMKQALSYNLWPEPAVPAVYYAYRRPYLIGQLLRLASRVLARWDYEIVWNRPCTSQDQQEGRTWPQYAETMIGLKRLDNLQHCVETVLREGVEGDLMETGVWRGGACIFMRALLAVHGDEQRRVILADSFEGLPKPDAAHHPADRLDPHHRIKYLAVSQAEVEANFRKYGLLDERVVFLKGWFKDTLPQAPVEKLAVLRLDGDMYGSTMDALVNLYPKLSPGGFCIVDDYALHGCRAAVDDFRAAQGISEPMQAVDWTGVYWRKEPAGTSGG